MKQEIQAGNYQGTIQIPSSKSDSQRVILLASLVSGKSILKNVGNSADEKAMLNAVQELGAKIKYITENTIEIEGFSHLSEAKEISLEESGLGFRLMASVLSLFSQKNILTGKGSLQNRPMDFFEEVFPKLKVSIQSNNGFLPLKIQGPIQGREIEIDGGLSSQFLSGLLIALPLAKGNSILKVRNLKSIPYIDMTLSSIEKFGVSIENHNYKEFRIKGNQTYKKTNYSIEGDWSSASYWLVASALGFDIAVENLDLESLQADKAILEVFKKANCEIALEENIIKIDGKNRIPFEFDATNCPDLFPALAVLASLTEGTSKILGTERLLHKESNRGQAIQEEFLKLGIQIKLEENTMLIRGKNKIQGGNVSSHNDHRIAMSLAILGMFSEEQITIDGSEAVAKSYPDFWKHLDLLK